MADLVQLKMPVLTGEPEHRHRLEEDEEDEEQSIREQTFTAIQIYSKLKSGVHHKLVHKVCIILLTGFL